MSKTRIITKKLKLILLATWLIMSNLSPALALEAATPSSSHYHEMTFVKGTDPELMLYLNKKSLNIDLLRTNNIRVRIKTSGLYSAIDKISSFKISMYEIINGERHFITSQTLTIFKGSKKSRIVSIGAGYFAAPVKQVEFDVFDTEGNLINTYATELTATNLASQVSGGDGVPLASAECDYTNFDDCQLDYLFNRITFEAKPQKQISTRVIKSEEGLYKVTIPVPRSQFKFLGRSVKRGKKDGINAGNGSIATSDFGDSLNISNIYIGNAVDDQGTINYNNNHIYFNNAMCIGPDGKLGVGYCEPEAWLHVKGGDGVSPSLIINPGTLSSAPKDGALEYDGSNVYFTINNTRHDILASGNNLILDPTTGKIDPVSLSPEVVLTSTPQTILNKTFIDTRFEGDIKITENASNGYVFTTDAGGNGTWQLPNTLGVNSNTIANSGIAIGSNLTSNAAYAMVIGKGNSVSDQLKNSIPDSLMIGLDSNISTMFIQSASGGSQLGRVGIGTTNPMSMLDVNGQIMIRGGSPGVNKVLTSDINGKASWTSSSSLSASNASLLDGLDSSQFLRSDTSDSFTSGTLTFDSGTGVDINSTTVSIADTDITLDGASTTFTQSSGAITMTPANGSNMNVRLDGVSDFVVDTNKLVVDNNGHLGVSVSPNGNNFYINGSVLSNQSLIKARDVQVNPVNAYDDHVRYIVKADPDYNISVNGYYYSQGFSTDASSNVIASGITDSGYRAGYTARSIRASANDLGTLVRMNSFDAVYGHRGVLNNSAITNNVYGIILTPSASNGTIQNLYDVYLGNLSGTAGTVNNRYSIYQADSNTKSYFAGNVGIGITTPQTKLDVNGQIMIRGGSPGVNKVLTSDINGKASWTSSSSLSASNASLLDGLDSSQFLRSDTSDSFTSGTLTFDSGTGVDINSTTVSIADTDISLDGASTTFTQSSGAITMTPANGSNMNVRLDGVSDFVVDTNKLVVDNNGDVGIGTSSPLTPLHIKNNDPDLTLDFSPGTIYNDAALYFANNGTVFGSVYGTRTTEDLVLRYDQDTDGNGNLHFLNSGHGYVMSMTPDSNVGIGTTIPQTKLDVNGQIMIRGGSPGVNKVLTSDLNGKASWTSSTSLSASNASLLDNLDSSQFLRSDTSDNFTSGTLTFDSGTGVDINSTSVSIADTNIDFDGGATTFNGSNAISMQPNNGSNLNVDLMGLSDFVVDTNKLVVNNNGNVGIGTASPLGRLDINNTVLPRSDMYLRDDTAVLRFVNQSGSNFIESGNGTASNSKAPLRFTSMNATTEWMRISSNGNVGIGTASPTALLDVRGTSFRNSQTTAMKTFVVAFPNSVADQKVDIYLNGTQAYWGSIDVVIADDYNWQNAAGTLTKRFYLGINPGGNIYTNEARYIDEGGATATNYAISDLRWDATNSRYYITIVHRVSTANSPTVHLVATAASQTQLNNFMNFTAGSVYTTDTTAYARPYVNFNNNVGIGTTSPQGKLDVNGTIFADNITLSSGGTINGATLINSNISKLVAPDGSPNPALSVDNSGNIGIGTASPTAALHIAKAGSNLLKVQDLDSALTTTADPYITFNTSDGTAIGYVGDGSPSDVMALVANSGELIIDTVSAKPIRFKTQETDRVSIDANGSVILSDSSELHFSGNHYNVLSYSSATTPTNGIKIKTNIPFTHGSQMPTIILEGYNYHYGSSLGGSIGIILNWYLYNLADMANPLAAPYLEASSYGDYTPQIKIARENNKVVLYINDLQYFTRFTVRAYDKFSTVNNSWYEGWTSADEALTGDQVATFPYANTMGSLTATNLTANGALTFSSGASNGYVLTSNTSGVATWKKFSGGSINGSVTSIDGLSDGKTSSTSVFLGSTAGVADSGTTYSTGVGIGALQANTSGGLRNSAFGYQAMNSNTTGDYNTATGQWSLYSNTTGSHNTVSGVNSLYNNTSGANGVAMGYEALYFNTSGKNNLASGYQSGFLVTTGVNNVTQGYKAGNNITTGSNNIIIGANTTSTSATASNRLNIGSTIYGDINNGNVGIGYISPGTKLAVNGTMLSKALNLNGNTVSIPSLSQGSLLFAKTAGALKRLAKGTNHYALKTNGNTLAWEPVGTSSGTGSWQLVYEENFETTPTGWSDNTTTSCNSHNILGGHNVLRTLDVSKTFDLSAYTHTHVMIKFNYYSINSWDLETALAKIDGTTVWASAKLDNDLDPERYQICGSGASDLILTGEGMYDHSSSSLTVTFGSTLDTGDEYYGIDNLEIWVK